MTDEELVGILRISDEPHLKTAADRIEELAALLERETIALECRSLALTATEKERDASDQTTVDLKEELAAYKESLGHLYELTEGITNESTEERAQIMNAEALVKRG